ncbi:hypothetical protein MAR_003416 [Mya arenaria]|uniref:IRS-type PTB domain-containing protein n=1 Tax=Mya arenaria TaxID=6604 RepID=A0ABY7G5Z9_MYAAR|nr:hypothetical protein MAR_003416 [Mya arenaria]
MHDRILKEHKVLDKSLQHLWSKQIGIIGVVQHKLSAKGNDSTYVNIARGKIQGRTKEIFGEILDSPLSKVCGIVGKATLYFDSECVHLQHEDRTKYVKIPLNIIRRYGYMQGFIFYIEVGRRFRFGEGFFHTKCCSREDAKLAYSYIDEVSKRKTTPTVYK